MGPETGMCKIILREMSLSHPYLKCTSPAPTRLVYIVVAEVKSRKWRTSLVGILLLFKFTCVQSIPMYSARTLRNSRFSQTYTVRSETWWKCIEARRSSENILRNLNLRTLARLCRNIWRRRSVGWCQTQVPTNIKIRKDPPVVAA
jgi:hypothetical protein